DVVEALEPLHDQLTDQPAGHLVLAASAQFVLDLVDHRLDVGHGNRALDARQPDRPDQLAPVVRFDGPIPLDDLQRPLFDVLVRREATAAAQALAPPPHRPALPAGARI